MKNLVFLRKGAFRISMARYDMSSRFVQAGDRNVSKSSGKIAAIRRWRYLFKSPYIYESFQTDGSKLRNL